MTKTQAAGRSLGATIRATGKILGGSDVANFTLMYMDGSADYAPGASQVIVYPIVEVGRDSACVVKFGKNHPSVSRKHAAFVQENGRVKIRHLSQTNQTYVRQPNGNIVTLQSTGQELDLENASEIQFSSNGPKVRFLTTETRTSSMGFTQRFHAMTKQALRPYRTAVASLAFLLLGTSAFAYYLNNQVTILDDDNKKLEMAFNQTSIELEETNRKLEENKNLSDAQIAKLKREQRALAKKRENEAWAMAKSINSKESYEAYLKLYPSGIYSSNARRAMITVTPPPPPPPPGDKDKERKPPVDPGSLSFKDMSSVYNDIYFIKVKSIEVSAPQLGIKKFSDRELRNAKWTGTGFLDTKGRLITARHVIQGWRFSPCSSQETAIINMLETTGGTVNVVFEAISPSGRKLEFPIRKFEYTDVSDIDGSCSQGSDIVPIKMNPPKSYKNDWAYVQTGERGKIVCDNHLSKNLKSGEEIVVLGYSFGQYMQTGNELEPILSKSSVGQGGLQDGGVIRLANRGFESGNSGGPAFVERGGKVYAIGIVSSGIESIGNLVPVANMY